VQLAVWTYEGPPHVGAMRVAAGMEGLHYVLHAPQGDTYADLLFTMIERRDRRPPVTYTTFEARDLGGDTAALFQTAAREAYDRFRPEAMIVGASCTGELIQDDPAGLAQALGLPVPVVPLELPSYARKENWGAAETFYQIVRALADRTAAPPPREGRRPRAAVLGPTALGFRHRDDVREVRRLLEAMGVDVMLVAPMGARPAEIARIGAADLAVCLYPETAEAACRFLERQFRMPIVRTVPIGMGATRAFLAEVAEKAGVDPAPALRLADTEARLPWWSRSVDSTYLTGKRVFVFGDATHAIALARVAAEEIGFEVAGLGCYNRECARELRAAAARYAVEPLVTDDHLEVEAAVAAAAPELVIGTQMERHIAKRLGIPCAVISAPAHVEDYPARHAPFMGFEGANVLFDTLVHPLVMGLEEHLLAMFRGDFEFHDEAGPSHLASARPAAAPPQAVAQPAVGAPAASGAPPAPGAGAPGPAGPSPGVSGHGAPPAEAAGAGVTWTREAEEELRKIPFFVRGKARRNTEAYVRGRGLGEVTLELLYEAKAHHGR